MRHVDSPDDFQDLLRAECALVIVHYDWSRQAALSLAVVAEFEISWSSWMPDSMLAVWSVKPDEQPYVHSWLEDAAPGVLGHGHGAVVWLAQGRVESYELYAAGAGLRELARVTRAVFLIDAAMQDRVDGD